MAIDLQRHEDGIDRLAAIAPGATVVGQVRLGARASVWFGAVIRGDTETIEVGADTNVQDLAILHADPGKPCRLGERVTVGHAAVVHGATVEDDCIIGIRAVVLNGAHVGAGSLVAAGAVIPEGMVVPAGSVVMGVPGKIVRQTTEADRARMTHAWKHYAGASEALRALAEKGS